MATTKPTEPAKPSDATTDAEVKTVTEEAAPDTFAASPAMFEFVRVADAALNGAHRTVRRFVADNNTKRYQILEDKPALDNRDRPLPAKPKN